MYYIKLTTLAIFKKWIIQWQSVHSQHCATITTIQAPELSPHPRLKLCTHETTVPSPAISPDPGNYRSTLCL